MKKILNDPISTLKVDDIIIDKLVSHNILTVNDLWVLKKKDLKEFLTDKEIIELTIKLQLNGLDLNKKVYK